MDKQIPVNTPLLAGNELKYLTECIETGWISSEGPFIKKFEVEFSNYIGRDYGIAVANGSAALDIAVKAIGITPGDEVIMPAFTIISPVASVVRQGGIPVLVDSHLDTWNMDVSQIEAKITKRTKAIIVVHIYGLPVDMNPIIELAAKYKLKIIEDAAEMHGQTYKGKKCGRFGDISIFSFYPNKHITTGEGGMILTDNPDLAKKCEGYRNLCFKPERRFVHDEIGWNYRMTNLQAAIGLAQLEKIEDFIIRKRTMGKIYLDALKNIDGFSFPILETEYATNIFWVFGIVSKNIELTAIDCMKKLGGSGIGTRPFFYPIHLQPVFKKMGLYKNESYPNAEFIAEQGFYLPSGLGQTEEDFTIVAEKFKSIFSEKK